nr:N acetyl D glucosamine kinase [Hymenolepis microstoma]
MEGYLCGIEGGTSASEVVIVSNDGEECAIVRGPHLNQWIIGLTKAVSRVIVLVEEALKKANLPLNTKFMAMGLALSGIDSSENARDFENEILRVRPEIADHIYVCNDCLGTIFTATDKGGIVLISGTGSNCKLIREDLSFDGVGGHGYMLGDEGSAFWIAHRAIKTYLDNDEGLEMTSYDTSAIKRVIFDYFGLKKNTDILTPHYYNFDKCYYAGLCKKVAELARIGDPLAQHLFYKAGFLLGAHVMAVLRKVDFEWLMRPEGVSVVCRGGVFNSWDLLEQGFADRVVPELRTKMIGTSIHLVLLTSSAATGAAFLAAHSKLRRSYPRKHQEKLLATFQT